MGVGVEEREDHRTGERHFGQHVKKGFLLRTYFGGTMWTFPQLSRALLAKICSR